MVRCANCGFLAARKTIAGADLTLDEVPEPVREDWLAPTAQFWREHANHAICLMRALPDSDKAEITTGGGAGSSKVVCRERQCAKFTPWIQGYTPKEHREMVEARELRDWMDEQRRKDQEREDRLESAREEQRTQERQAERAWLEKQRQNDEELQKKRDRETRRWQIILAILTACISIPITLLVAYLVWVFGLK